MHQIIQRMRRALACLLLSAMGVFVLLAVPLAGQAESRSAEAFPAGSLLANAIRYEFALYYTGSPRRPPLDALQARLKQTPDAPALVDFAPKPLKAAVMRARLNSKVQQSYAPPSPDSLQRFGRGLTREQAAALQGSQQALILDFAHPAALSFRAYRTSLQLTEQLARDTGGLIWDEETREMFSPDAWHKRRLESWDDGIPNVEMQTVIHAYRGEQLVRGITLGMAKFGLPDVVVEDFSWSTNKTMGHLINLLSQAMAEGVVVGDKGYLDIDIHTLKHLALREVLLSSLKPKSSAKAALVLVKGTPDKGDPENRLVEIRFDRAEGRDRHAQQDALLDALFGAEDSIKYIKHDEQLLAASKAAKAKLPALRDAFNKGLQPGEYLMLKAPFATPAGGQEWMWVEVTAWTGENITGLLKNQPFNIPKLKAGEMVKVAQSDVFDYIHQYTDGRSEGNETGKIIERMQGPSK